jgi:hypothetical protein
MSRPVYAIVGLLVGAAVDILVNLIAAAIQQRAFPGQFSTSAIVWLVGLAVVGLLIGYWLSGPVQLPVSPSTQPGSRGKPTGVTLTRFRALLSYGKLRGMGIHLNDILLIGSRLDIDTKD